MSLERQLLIYLKNSKTGKEHGSIWKRKMNLGRTFNLITFILPKSDNGRGDRSDLTLSERGGVIFFK